MCGRGLSHPCSEPFDGCGCRSGVSAAVDGCGCGDGMPEAADVSAARGRVLSGVPPAHEVSMMSGVEEVEQEESGGTSRSGEGVEGVTTEWMVEETVAAFTWGDSACGAPGGAEGKDTLPEADMVMVEMKVEEEEAQEAIRSPRPPPSSRLRTWDVSGWCAKVCPSLVEGAVKCLGFANSVLPAYGLRKALWYASIGTMDALMEICLGVRIE